MGDKMAMQLDEFRRSAINKNLSLVFSLYRNAT